MIQLYSLATPNGQKASIALEELELKYDAHKIDILKGDQFAAEFIKINPNSKIPAIVDEDAPGGPLAIMESGAILLYLAEKTGRLISKDPRERNQILQWLFFQVGSIGPMFGQFGHFFKYAKETCDHPYPVERYTKETKRLLNVLETQLRNRNFIASEEYSIADISIFPWVDCLSKFYQGDEILELKNFTNVNRWVKTCMERPAVQRGLKVCGFDH